MFTHSNYKWVYSLGIDTQIIGHTNNDMYIYRSSGTFDWKRLPVYKKNGNHYVTFNRKDYYVGASYDYLVVS